MNIPPTPSKSWFSRFGKASPQVPDINLIPEDFAGSRLLSRDRLLALAVVLEFLLVIVLFQSYGEGTLTTIRGIMGAEEAPPTVVAPPPDPIATQIKQARTRLTDLEVTLDELNNQRTDWPQVLDLIFNNAPDGVTVKGFQQAETVVTISGLAQEHADVLEHQFMLNESPLTSKVIVPAIRAATGDSWTFTVQISLKKGLAVE